MNSNKSYSELEHLELVARRIAESGIDITCEYKDWITVTLACASVGEAAREAYHTICSQYAGYKREECDEKFDNCLSTGRGDVRLASLIQLAKDAGIDVTLPRGRRKKTEGQRKEEQQNRIQQMRDALKGYAQWRFNTWYSRPELKEGDNEWRELKEQDLDTYYIRLKLDGVNVRISDVKSMLWSRDFSPQFDACRDYLDHLPAWNPETSDNPIRDMFEGHLVFSDPENKDYYVTMLTKWFLAMVSMMQGKCDENPQMPIFEGHQHIGKTYFSRHILPPCLRSYRIEVSPAQMLDKDFLSSLSDTPLMIFDEISFGSSQKANALKHAVTLNETNIREAYGHFREKRHRRASLIATTNDEQFLRDTEGNRRYLVISLKETVNLNEHPINYDGAYAQAVYLLSQGEPIKPTKEESQLISEHNKRYLMPNDCEEVLKTFLRIPSEMDNTLAMTAGDILTELGWRGHRGRMFCTSEIGKAMKHMGFDSRRSHGTTKYLVVKIDPNTRKQENIDDAKEFIPDSF